MEKRNYLKDNKELMKEYDYDKNTEFDLDNLTMGSHKKVWWKCSKGHEWIASISHRSKGRNCPYCANQKVLIGFNDLKTTCPEVAKEWNYEKNELLKPYDVMRGSDKIVWWKCQKGHEWQTSVNKKSHGSKCPYCSNKALLRGFNDLATIYPEIAKEWNYEKNGLLKPYDILPTSKIIVWWKCQKGHEWQTSVNKKTHGSNCPYCHNRITRKVYNDLATICPEIVEEWNYKKNGMLMPENYSIGSGKVVWWKCKICGYEWKTRINYRVNYKSICPACQARNGKGHKLVSGVNDFETWCKSNNKGYLLKEWNYDRNGNLLPKDVSYGSSKMIWWKCENSHEYIQRLNHKTGKEDCGCPYCMGVKVLKGFNDLESWCKKNNRLDILNEYNDASNSKGADEVLFSSPTKYNFKCRFGHLYSRDIHDKTLNFAQCPICQKANKVSIKEKTFFYYLKKYADDVVENYILDKSKQKELDIYIPSIHVAVEYDGQFYHKNDKRDIEKNLLCKKNEYIFISN